MRGRGTPLPTRTGAADPTARWPAGSSSAAAVSARVTERFGSLAQGYRNVNPAGDAIAAAQPNRSVKVCHMPALPYPEGPAAISAVHASRGWIGEGGVRVPGADRRPVGGGRVRDVGRARPRRDDVDGPGHAHEGAARAPRAAVRLGVADPARSRAPQSDRRHGRVCRSGPEPARQGLSEGGTSELVKILGIAAVPHGFHSSFRDWAAERTTHPREFIEATLAHVVQNRVQAANVRSDRFERRPVLMNDHMDAWAEHLGEERGQVVTLRRR